MSKRKNQKEDEADDNEDEVLSDNEGDEVESPKPKSSSSSSSTSAASKKKPKSNGEVSFDIGEKRKVTVSEFKGMSSIKTITTFLLTVILTSHKFLHNLNLLSFLFVLIGKLYVNIREYYEDKASGDLKPGAKGIALTIDQFNSLKSQINEIDAAISNFWIVYRKFIV